MSSNNLELKNNDKLERKKQGNPLDFDFYEPYWKGWKYHCIRIGIINLLIVLTSAPFVADIFYSETPDHYCDLGGDDTNYKFWRNESNLEKYYPLEEPTVYSSCEMYVDTDTNVTYGLDGRPTLPCGVVNGWVYLLDAPLQTYGNSPVKEWDIVCDDLWLAKLSQSLYMVGLMLGVLLCGTISDKFGRKPMFFILLIIQIVISAITAAMPNFYGFMFCRLLIGSTTASVYLMMFTLAMELVSSKWRTTVGMACEMYFGIGIMLLAAIAYLIQEWRYLQLAISFLPLPLLLTWWIIPESPRWLMSKGRYREAWVIINKIASVNGKVIPDDIEEAFQEAMTAEEKHIPLDDFPDESVKTYTALDLFRHKKLIIRTIILVFNWIVNSMVYYGLSLNSADLGGNVYINTLMAGAVEIPATLIAIFFLAKVGRKYTLAAIMIGAGVACISTVLFTSEETQWLAVTMAMVGKFAITATFAIIYVYSAELYPTVIRNIGVGFCSFMARIGSILSPFIALLGNTVWAPLPFIIFGVFAILAGLSVFFLPETVNKPLPDTIDDIEDEKKTCPNPKPEDVDKIEIIVNTHTKPPPMIQTETSM